MNRACKLLAVLLSVTFAPVGCGDEPLSPSDAGAQDAGVDAPAVADAPLEDEAPADPGGAADPGGVDDSTTGPADTPDETVDPGLGPPYPIVLAHGFFGFDEFAGLGFLNYFYEVLPHLAAYGEELVFTPEVDPFNNSTYRGNQLIQHVEAILAQTGHAKVNIIGHSQGGLDARVVAHERPELVASVTTYATPHGGTLLGDIAVGAVPYPAIQDIIDWLVQMAGQWVYNEVDEQTSLFQSMYQFSQEGIAAFDAEYPDAPGVLYFSLTGRTDYHLGGADCVPDLEVPFVSAWKDETDPVEPLFIAPEMVLDGGLTDPFPNDGLVRARDAKWGTFLGCVPADHLDQIGHLFGDPPGLFNDWSYLYLYADLIAFLRAQGL